MFYNFSGVFQFGAMINKVAPTELFLLFMFATSYHKVRPSGT
jgi:hypothetical protein